jgi:SagB-type dehydrogenase family enzyme
MNNARRHEVGRFLSEALSFLGILSLLFATLFILADPASAAEAQGGAAAVAADDISLPAPAKTGTLSVEAAMAQRRSVRELTESAVTLNQLSQLLWAAQGITDEKGLKRTAPSAGAKYPIEIFIVAGKVDGLPAGIYRYHPKTHSLVLVKRGDVRPTLCDEAVSQEWVRSAPLDIIITAVYERTRVKYGERAERYVHIEVGAVAENVYLEAESLGLATTFVGAFTDEGVKKVLGLGDEAPLGIMPIGVGK